ncbi:MAG: phosphate regulon sensor histidine kinase PhoR [Pseudohongiellaceae bacterium]|nr:phosphate regulon sensor histidine kinase PhoR [Pseudomonadota bacterium]
MQAWRSELRKQVLILVSVCLVGYSIGQFLPALLLLLVCYVLFNLVQLHRLTKWLAKDHASDRSAPPEGFGLWGGVFDGIYRLQKQERRASAYLENIVNKAQESSAALEMAIIMVDRNNNLDWWNKATESLLGLRYPEDRRLPVTNLIRDPAFTAYFGRNVYDEPLHINAPGDSGKRLEIQIALFGENERLIIVRDISQLHRLELMRKDFVGNVSHELGTPITVIKGYLEAILDNIQDLDGKWEKPVIQMHQQSSRMENIVKDLLALSALETGTPSRKQSSFALIQLLSEIVNDARQIFAQQDHQFSLSCDENIKFIGDRGELYSAIANLVSNAAKYTPYQGKINILIRLSEDFLEAHVEDNGPGIEAQHLPRLTERFYRVDVSRSSETGGTGLGLAIVKHIVNRHDGELTVSSEVGKGSCFTCRFPLSRVKTDGRDTVAADERAETPATLMDKLSQASRH